MNKMHMEIVKFVAGQQTFTMCQIYAKNFYRNKNYRNWKNAETK